MTTNVDIPFYLVAPLPELGSGAPPAACPVCGASQVPPESDDGIPPPELHEYQCNATYMRLEDQPDSWEPCHRCGRVPLLAAAAWIRDFCARTAAPAESIMREAVSVPAPYECTNGPVLEVLFGNIQGERPPETCPSCGAEGTLDPPSSWSYACGATLAATSARRTPDGYVPTSWVGRGGCPRAPLGRLLEILHRMAVRDDDRTIAAAAKAAIETVDRHVEQGANGGKG